MHFLCTSSLGGESATSGSSAWAVDAAAGTDIMLVGLELSGQLECLLHFLLLDEARCFTAGAATSGVRSMPNLEAVFGENDGGESIGRRGDFDTAREGMELTGKNGISEFALEVRAVQLPAGFGFLDLLATLFSCGFSANDSPQHSGENVTVCLHESLELLPLGLLHFGDMSASLFCGSGTNVSKGGGARHRKRLLLRK